MPWKFKKKTLLLLFLLLLFFSGYFLFSDNFNARLSEIFSPLKARLYARGVVASGSVDSESLITENQKLREEMVKDLIDRASFAALQAENAYLKRELNFIASSELQYQTAAVIGRMPLNQQQLTISAGAASGLREGLAVTFNSGVIIGKIIKVEENTAIVALLTESDSQLAVTTANLNGTSGLLKSQAGLSVSMELIPQDKEIVTGDLVITSGLENDIPRGLIVGTVEAIETNVGQIFKNAKILLPFDYNTVLWVTVIKPQ